MITSTDFTDYMRTLATQLIAISHTDQNPAFARNEDEGLEGSAGKLDYSRPTIVMREYRARFWTNRADWRQVQHFRQFDLVMKVDRNDFAAEEATYKLCEEVLFKLFSKMYVEWRTKSGLLAWWDFENTTWQRIGPEYNNCFGLNCTLPVKTDTTAYLQYNSADWL